METSRFERVLTKLEMATSRISDKIAKDMKNVKPFDKEVETSKEKIYKYLNIPEEQKQMARMQMPGFGAYEREMRKLMNRNNMNSEVL